MGDERCGGGRGVGDVVPAGGVVGEGGADVVDCGEGVEGREVEEGGEVDYLGDFAGAEDADAEGFGGHCDCW